MSVATGTSSLVKTLETDAAHIVATAGTAFGVSIAELGTNYTKAGIITAAVAAVHFTFAKFFPSNVVTTTVTK